MQPNSKNTALGIIFILIGIIALTLGWAYYKERHGWTPDKISTQANSTTFDQSVSDNTITVPYPSDMFALALNTSQILTQSSVPPCDPNFSYCLYYNGNQYAGTNFESAGIRIQKRNDITNEQMCLNSPPTGFDSSTTPDAKNSGTDQSASVFSNVDTGGAGHYATGSLYRLFVRSESSCYEFETRIAQTQFQNYATGTIAEFTSADQQALQTELGQIISQVSVRNSKTSLFP